LAQPARRVQRVEDVADAEAEVVELMRAHVEEACQGELLRAVGAGAADTLRQGLEGALEE
jgi:hypothetical protein